VPKMFHCRWKWSQPASFGQNPKFLRCLQHNRKGRAVVHANPTERQAKTIRNQACEMCRIPTSPVVSHPKYDGHSATGFESDLRLSIPLKQGIRCEHFNIEVTDTLEREDADGALRAFTCRTNRSNIHCGALLTKIRLSVLFVFATRTFPQNSGSCREIEMCEPREERQPATTAHRGAVQALRRRGWEGLSLENS
jgi:hypothetical protein